MNVYVPRQIFFHKRGGDPQGGASFLRAWLSIEAGIEKCNLVQVSSILPPGCQVIARPGPEGSSRRRHHLLRSEPLLQQRTEAAAGGIRRLRHPSRQAHLRLHQRASRLWPDPAPGGGLCGRSLPRLCSHPRLALTSISMRAGDEKREIFKISGKIVSTRNITQSSIVQSHGFTTAIAVAVFVF